MKRLVIALLFLTIFGSVQSQDSLSYKIERLPNDSMRLDFITTVLEDNIHRNPQLVVRYSYQVSNIVQRMNPSSLVAHTHLIVGDNYRQIGMYDRALTSYSSAQRMAQKLALQKLEGEIFLKIGSLYLEEQVYALALENFFRAKELFRNNDDLVGLAQSYRMWSDANLKTGDFTEALRSLNNALETAQNSKDKTEIAKTLNALGKIHELDLQYEKSLEYYDRVQKILEGSDQKEVLATTYKYIGDCYFKMNDFQKSLENYIKALWIHKSDGNRLEEANSYLSLARLYLSQEDYRQVENIAGQALKISSQNGFLQPLKNSYLILSQASLQMNDYQTALANYREYARVKDSIFNGNIANVITDVEVRNETDKKNREIAELEKAQLQQQIELGEKRSQRNILLMVLIFTAIIALTLFYLYWSKNLANKLILESKQQAEEATRAKANFLSTMSHEIRTPMNAIIGMTHLLHKEHSLEEEQKEKVDIINFSANNLLNLINDILDFSKIESGKIEFEKVDFKPRDLVKNLYKTFQSRAEDKGLSLNYKVGPSVPECVKGDPSRLSQILINLISNALKFTDKGEVSIWVDSGSTVDNSVELEFKVLDTGIGIPKDKHDKIFESFSQAETDTTRKFGGTGLGLTITKSLTYLMGGNIKLLSQPGFGSEFIIRIPFEISEAKPEAVAETSPIEAIKNLAGKRVLVVEDDLINQKVAENILSGWELDIEVAENGRVALNKLEKADFDLVLMDLHMPEMDGYEATVAIRQLENERKKNIPIIALTADAFIEVKEKILESQMNDYVSKPFVPKELQEKLIKNMTA